MYVTLFPFHVLAFYSCSKTTNLLPNFCFSFCYRSDDGFSGQFDGFDVDSYICQRSRGLPPVTNFYVVEVVDINDPPSLQSFSISLLESIVPLENASSPYSFSQGITGFIATDPDGIYYRALDPDKTISTEREKNQFYNDYSLIDNTLWVVRNLPNSEQHATLLPLFQLDYETKKAYNVTVVVTDGRGTNGTGVVNVLVSDVNEPPSIASIGVTASEGVKPRSFIPQLSQYLQYPQYCKHNATKKETICAANVTNSKIVDFAQYQYNDPEDGSLSDPSKLPQGTTFSFKDGSSTSPFYPPQKVQCNCQSTMWSIFFY